MRLWIRFRIQLITLMRIRILILYLIWIRSFIRCWCGSGGEPGYQNDAAEDWKKSYRTLYSSHMYFIHLESFKLFMDKVLGYPLPPPPPPPLPSCLMDDVTFLMRIFIRVELNTKFAGTLQSRTNKNLSKKLSYSFSIFNFIFASHWSSSEKQNFFKLIKLCSLHFRRDRGNANINIFPRSQFVFSLIT